MDEQKLEKLKKLLEIADSDYVSSSDFIEVINAIIDGVNVFRKAVVSHVTDSDKALAEKMDKFISVCERQLQVLTTANDSQTTLFRKELAEEVYKLKESIESIELTPGENGDDAEFTDEIKEEIIEKVIKELKAEYDPKLKKQIEDAVKEALKDMKPNTTIIRESGGIGAPFEIPIKAGTNVTVTKDASGAYVISATGGSSENFADNEVATGSGTSFSIAHTPVAGSTHVYANGQRLTPTVDYTISAANITTLQSWDAGVILVDYRY